MKRKMIIVLCVICALVAALPFFAACDFGWNEKKPDPTVSFAASTMTLTVGETADAAITFTGAESVTVTVNPEGAFTLRPDIEHSDPAETLVLGTPLTLAGLQAKEKGFSTADTGELAVLVEIRTSLSFKSKTRLGVPELSDYLELRLSPFKGIKKVLLGCSHYIYLSREISRLYPGASVVSGNLRLAEEVAEALGEKPENDGLPALPSAAEEGARVKTVFTGEREERKYRWLLSRLLTAPPENL